MYPSNRVLLQGNSIDAILARLVLNAFKIELNAESMRKRRETLDRKAESVTD
jgi:hypothetical protein